MFKNVQIKKNKMQMCGKEIGKRQLENDWLKHFNLGDAHFLAFGEWG